jgi:hypothetical protein
MRTQDDFSQGKKTKNGWWPEEESKRLIHYEAPKYFVCGWRDGLFLLIQR